jgi:hypothetical protein
LLVIEGAAGAGKTTTLAAARDLLDRQGHRLIVVTPTLKAARVAEQQVGADAFSTAWLIHQHGFRWDDDGYRSRVETPRAQIDAFARLLPGDVLLVDDAGMLDQDVARAPCSPSPTKSTPGSPSSVPGAYARAHMELAYATIVQAPKARPSTGPTCSSARPPAQQRRT